MRTELFDFDLPRDRIALRPTSPRDAARLLVIRPGMPFEDRTVLDQAIEERGDMPLPPYIRRAPDERDRVDYQTVFARAEGSVAAPTAALHFTETLLSRLRERGIGIELVTLHVGAGTFLPVKTE